MKCATSVPLYTVNQMVPWYWSPASSSSTWGSALRILALGALLWPAARAWELTILHTNDVHSRLEQTSEDSSKCVNASRCVGGAARLATKVHQIRRAEPHVLLLDAGA